MRGKQSLSVLVSVLVIAAALGPGLAFATDPLNIGVTQDASTGSTSVTVTHNGTAVDNATVNVASPNGTYAGVGTYTTDANGTIDLPAPNETVQVVISATSGNFSGTTSTYLSPAAELLSVTAEQTVDGKVTVTVERNGTGVGNATVDVSSINGTYAGDGAYTADDNGSVSLPAPNQSVTVTITATHDGRSATITVELMAADGGGPGSDSFGQLVAWFVDQLRQDYGAMEDFPMGHEIATFVHENNPGSPPDHAGPPNATDTVADDGNATDEGDRGPPEHAKGGDKGTNGSDNGNGNGNDGNSNGPPDHAKDGDKGNGQGNNGRDA